MNELLLLIDIDGTLLTTNGVAIQLMIRAAEAETGQSIPFCIGDYLGKLDPQIIETLLNRGGYDEKQILESRQRVYEHYIRAFKPALKGEHVTVYPGVREFLDYIQDLRLKFGVLTGNTRAGAGIKLGAVGFDRYFPFGAFGDDALTRPELVPIAQSRAEQHFRQPFFAKQMWIIGDSVNDIICARENGIRCCIVKTGKTDPEKLASLQPEILVDNLENREAIIREMKQISNLSD